MLKKTEPSQSADLKPKKFHGINLNRTIIQSVLMVVVLGLAALIVGWMVGSKPERPKRAPFERFISIESITSEIKNHQPKFVAYGTVVAGRSIDIRSSVVGEVVALNDNLRVGYKINAGDELLELDDFAYQGALREANANLLQNRASLVENEANIANEKQKLATAREQLKLAESDLARAMKLRKNGTVTQKNVDDKSLVISQRRAAVQGSESALEIAKARYEGQKATLSRLEWRVQEAKRNLDNTKLTAPFSGIVSQSNIEVGKLLGNNEVIASLYDGETLEVKFTLTDEQFGRLHNDEAGLIGRKVDVQWKIGEQTQNYQATINRIGAEISTNRGGVDVYASFDKQNGDFEIRPGAFVEILVPDRVFENTVRVPDTSVYDGERLYVVVGDSLEERKIEIALYDGEYALVSKGLKAGDKVLTTRIAQVSSGLKVKEFNAATASDNNAAKPAENISEREALVKKVQEANKLSVDEWKALPRDKKREMMNAFKEKPKTGSN